MLGTKFLFLSVLAYASGQGVSYYGSSSVRTQSRLPPRPLSYRPDYAGKNPVYNPQPIYQAPIQLPEQPVPEPQAPQDIQPPLRPPQPTYVPFIPPSTAKPRTDDPEISPQPIYSPIPPHSAIPLPPSSGPTSPGPLPAWSWRPATPEVVIIDENPTTPSQIVYSGSTSKSVEPSVELFIPSLEIEEHTFTSKPEEEATSTLSVSESSSVTQYHEQLEPSTRKPLPELDVQLPQTSSSSSDPFSQKPLTDPILEPSSEQPQPALDTLYVSSSQPPSTIQDEISPYQSYSYPEARPLPASPSTTSASVISQEPQPVELESVSQTEAKPVDPVLSVPSYQPIELQEPLSTPIQPPARPNYQPPTPSSPPQPLPVPQISTPAVRPNYYPPPVPAPEPVHIPLSYQPIAPAPVVQYQPPLAPRPSYQPIQPSQRPAYQPPIIQQPLPIAQPIHKPIQNQIPQQPLPVVQTPPNPVAISQPQVPPYPSGPVLVPEAFPIDDFQCNAGKAYYRVVNECDSYIACQGQRAWKHICPDGLHFNPRAQYPEYPCSYPSEVKCDYTASKQVAQPTSECPNQYGFFPLPGGDCSRYIMCQEGKASVMSCPFGLVFNNQLSSCDWPENVPQCSPSAFKDFSCPIPPEDDPDYLTRHRYGNDCGMYVACQHGHPRLLKCDLGLSFDEDSQVCIDTDLVEKCRQMEARYQ